MAVFHLAAVAFKTNRTGVRDLERILEDFAVADAMGFAAFDRNDDFIPILSLVMFQVIVGAGEQVVAALELWLADEDAAVGIRRSAKFELEDEILRKFACGPKGLDFPALRRCGDNQA